MSKRTHSSNQTNSSKLPNLQTSKRIQLSDNNVELLRDNTAPSSDLTSESLPLSDPQISSVNDAHSSTEILDSMDLPPMLSNDSEPLRCMECRALLMDPSMSFLLKNFNFPVCDSCRFINYSYNYFLLQINLPCLCFLFILSISFLIGFYALVILCTL